MKKLLIVLLLCSSIIFGQTKEINNERLTGSFSVDSKISFTETQDQIDQGKIYLEKKKSPLLAAVLSLAVPGAGDLYNGEIWKTALFIAIEAAAITTSVIYNNKGDDQTEFFESYADQHWSVQQYAEWTLDNATRINSNVDPARYNIFNNDGSVNWNELNSLENAIGSWYSHQLAPRGDQQYYEMIGKYQQFNAGWDDFTEDPSDPYTYGDPLTDKFIFYSGERGKANDFYDVAKWAVIGVVTNHIISAVEAAWSAGKYNRRLKMELGIEKEQIGFRTEYYPQLSVRFNF